MFESITRVLRTELRIAAETGASSFSIDQTSLIGRFPGLAQPAHSAPVAETSLNSDAAAGRLHVAFALRRRQSQEKPPDPRMGKKAMKKFIPAAALVTALWQPAHAQTILGSIPEEFRGD